METLLEVRKLEICYRTRPGEHRRAVNGVSFEIGAGEVVGLMGESGCGKTSLALSLLGLLSKDRAEVSGAVVFRGRDLLCLGESALRRIRGAQISLIHQEPEIALCPVMRVGQQIAEVIRAHRDWAAGRRQEEAEALLARVGFPEAERISRRYPHQLSGGQRQRVLLAQAIACEPVLIIADEPTASLDARSQSEFLGLLRAMKEHTHTALLLISHAPEVQASLADRLLVMADGQIIEQGEVRQLCTRPSDPRTRNLLARRAAFRSSESQSVEHQLVP